MSLIKSLNDVEKLIKDTGESIGTSTLNQISKEKNLTFLSRIGDNIKERIKNINENNGLDLEDIKLIISDTVNEILCRNPIMKACEDLGLKYKNLSLVVRQTLIISELNGENVFIAGQVDGENEESYYKEKLLSSLVDFWEKIIKSVKTNKNPKNSQEKKEIFKVKSIPKKLISPEIKKQEESDKLISPEIIKGEEIFETEDELVFDGKNQLEYSMDKLKKSGLIIENGVLDFSGFEKDYTLWPDIFGIKLIYFPNSQFNRKYEIGNSNGKILKVKDLEKMFEKLGFEIGDEIVKVDCINENSETTKDFKLIIGGKNEIHNEIIQSESFKENELEIDQKIIENEELKLIFKQKIIDAKLEIEEETGIIEENGIWYFCNCNGSWKNKVRALGKKLSSYPNKNFNIYNKIGNHEGRILSLNDIKDMFEKLGFQIADHMQEKVLKNKLLKNQFSLLIPKWKKQLEDSKEILEKQAGIIEENGIWYFFECNNDHNKWPLIGNLNLKKFPGKKFIKYFKLGSYKFGEIKEISRLKIMFETLGLNVATKKQDAIKKKLIMLEKEIIRLMPQWKKQLEDSKEILEKQAGIIEENGIWYFCNCKSKLLWPNIGGKNLGSITNETFRKKCGVKFRSIKTKNELKEVFQNLGFKIADEKAENEMKQKIINNPISHNFEKAA